MKLFINDCDQNDKIRYESATEKSQGQNLGYNTYDYASSDHFKDNLFTDKLQASDQSNHLRTDKILRVTKAIAEWESHGIVTHSHLSLYKFSSFFMTTFSYQDVCLLCTKQLHKVKTKILQSAGICFPFLSTLVFYLKTSNDLLSEHMHLNIITAYK